MADPSSSHFPHSDQVTERDEDAWRQLESVHTGDLPVETFEQWVYSRADLEALLGPALALDFLTLDYRRPHAHHELRKLVERAYMQRRPKQLQYDMMRRIAREFLSGERDVWRTTAPLARLIATGKYDWIPPDFLYLDPSWTRSLHPRWVRCGTPPPSRSCSRTTERSSSATKFRSAKPWPCSSNASKRAPPASGPPTRSYSAPPAHASGS
ncbi:MAG TPA: hypothetical protein VGB92_23085 [Longimicrobium sp.]